MPEEQKQKYSDAFSSDPEVRLGHKKLTALKARLQADPELGKRVVTYTAGWNSETNTVFGLEEFGDLVYSHLWALLKEETEEYVSQPSPTWEEQERAALAEFVELRRRCFTGRGALLQQLVEHAVSQADGTAAGSVRTEDGTKVLCVTGSSGSGKSALFAELYNRLSIFPKAEEGNGSSSDPGQRGGSNTAGFQDRRDAPAMDRGTRR